MKKLISLILILCLSISVCACGNSSSVNDASSSENSSIEVDENLLSVEVSLPASFFEDESAEDIKASAKENGFSDCTIHEDGSVTYKMSKSKHREIMSDLKISLEESVENMLTGDEAVESFINIEYSDNFSKFDVYVDPEKYTVWDGIYSLVFYMSGAFYQLFDGNDINNVDVIVNFINSATNEIIETGSFREWTENMESDS